jgi:hypothetical protein
MSRHADLSTSCTSASIPLAPRTPAAIIAELAVMRGVPPEIATELGTASVAAFRLMFGSREVD